MNDPARELTRIVEDAAPRLRSMAGERTGRPTIGGGWSARQILGHLIDSAANNHQRFVRARFVDDLVFPGYEQERWIEAQGYDAEPWPSLVEFWRLYNLHLAHVVAQIPEAVLARPRLPHTLDKIAWKPVRPDEPASLGYLVEDYIGHLQDHLAQLFAAASS